MSQILELAVGKLHPPKATYPSMHNRTVIVTGSNTGLGLEAALKFVQLGAKLVVLAVRSLSKGEEAKRKILARAARFNARVEVWECDMLDYDSLRRFAQRAERELPDGKLDYLVLNAGILSAKLGWGKYGWENMLQCHVLSTTYLALLMLPLMEQARDTKEGFVPVLEFVNSTAHSLVPSPVPLFKGTREADAPLEVYNQQNSGTLPLRQYAYTKLFLMYAQASLLKTIPSLARDSPDVYCVAVCPGAVWSDIHKDYFPALSAVKSFLGALLARSTEEGARTYISGVTLGAEGHGRFWTSDHITPPAAILQGEENEVLRAKVWNNILSALRKDIPDVDQLLSR